MKKPLLILLTAFCTKGMSQVFPNLGGQRAGISALTFLKNDLSARSAAMGGASIALTGDAFSMAVNPAGAASVSFPSIALSSRTNATGLVQSYLGVALPQKNSGVWMASMNYLSSGLQKRRTEFQPMGDGSLYSADAFKAGVGYSRALSRMFSCGMNLNFVHEQLAQYRASAVTADLGFLYKTDWKDLSFAVGFQHFGGNSTLRGDALAVDFNRAAGSSTEGYGSPTMFSMGVSMLAFERDRHKILASAQLNHPNDNAENIRLGVQYTLDSIFHLRVGYKINVIGEGISAGAGVKSRIGAFPFTIEYALVPNRYLGICHTLGLSIGLFRPGNFAPNEPLPGILTARRKKNSREKIEIDTLDIRLISQPRLSEFSLTLLKPMEQKYQPEPFPQLTSMPVRQKAQGPLPAQKTPKPAKLRKKSSEKPTAASEQKTPTKVKRRISQPKSGKALRSIWEKPYPSSWTEKQWQIFLKERYSREINSQP